jgi:HD-GYP domain-containing protein (c-di-GMP phosphodiesterase class II)
VLKNDSRNERILEIMLVLVTLGLACLLHATTAVKLMVLNLFYLPVVLAGFFLGRYRAGVLALLSVVVATIVVMSDLHGFMSDMTPLMVAIAVTLWGAVLGLTSLLVGTLCDDRDSKATEAHEAHVGVVEVLARYLQSANPTLQHRALRVAQLSELVARRMRLSAKEIDDIRVAALLVDMENIEITARVIRKAVDELEDSHDIEQRTFNGTELVQSLGSALKGAFPLLLAQTAHAPGDVNGAEVPFGARIIRAVRALVQLTDSSWDRSNLSPQHALDDLRTDVDADYHPAVLHALEEVLATQALDGESAAAAPHDRELEFAGAR